MTLWVSELPLYKVEIREHRLSCEHGADIVQGRIRQLYGSLILTEHMEQSV